MKVVLAFTLMAVFLGSLLSLIASDEDNREIQEHIVRIASGIENGRIQRIERKAVDGVKLSLKAVERMVTPETAATAEAPSAPTTVAD